MRAEFSRPDSPDQIVGAVTWDGSGIRVETGDNEARAMLNRIFRATAVSVDDPALRPAGSGGPVVLLPGSLSWFQTAARERSKPEGLAVRLIPEDTDAMGWDPAGAYRTFGEAVERKEGFRSRQAPAALVAE